jgi:hypothetical protein
MCFYDYVFVILFLMKTVLLITLIAIAFTARVQERNLAKITTDLKKSTYGSALLHLVELHSMAGGPV